MSSVTSEMIKELRERTGVGMAKCKEALEESAGDMERAIDYLRKAGMASAVKKESRETKEGSIGSAETNDAIALVEVDAETDFVTQNDKFKQFLKEIAEEAVRSKPSSLDAFLSHHLQRDKSLTIDGYRSLIVQSLGENIKIKRLLVISKKSGFSYGTYSHMGGKIFTLVEIGGASGFEVLARDIAMHVAAESPDYLRPDDVPADVKAREEDIARSQVQGKPPAIVDKIIEGKIKAFYDLVCLVCQKFIKDNSMTISQLLEWQGKGAGKHLTLARFIRWKVGE